MIYRKTAKDWIEFLGANSKIRISKYAIVSLNWQGTHLTETGSGYTAKHLEDSYINIASYFRLLESSKLDGAMLPISIQDLVEKHSPYYGESGLEIKCVCAARVLMLSGCKCGAFKKESSAAYLGKKKFA